MLCDVAKHCRFLCYRQVIAGFKLLIGEKRQSFREKPKKMANFCRNKWQVLAEMALRRALEAINGHKFFWFRGLKIGKEGRPVC